MLLSMATDKQCKTLRSLVPEPAPNGLALAAMQSVALGINQECQGTWQNCQSNVWTHIAVSRSFQVRFLVLWRSHDP